MIDLVKLVAKELSLNEAHVRNCIQLLVEEEATIPFVARYRKEATGSMDEVKLRDVRDRFQYLTELEATKEKYLKAIEELSQEKPEIAAKLPELKEKFAACATKQDLEDLYLPFKPKRRTRAQLAKEKGLEPLLDEILSQRAALHQLLEIAEKYVTADNQELEEKLRTPDAQSALAGAADIMAERINETIEIRQLAREMSHASGLLVAEKADTRAIEANPKKRAAIVKYQNYFDYKEPIKDAVSHRIMAVRRGESEKILRLSIEVDADRIVENIISKIAKSEPTSPNVLTWLCGICEDAYRRLLAPSIETELRLELKKQAEAEAIRVFSTNLENLLLLPPIPHKTVMGIDPGIRTGSKIAVVSDTGKLLTYATVYPEPEGKGGPRTEQAIQTLKDMFVKHSVGYVSIGNGTGSREIDQVVLQAIQSDPAFSEIKRVVVNEAGASVYSTDSLAREEFPDLDPTIRSAVSIARRLQDPLAELVKIDPKSIGVGQYQHDCNPGKLNRSLKETVESCVNRVGVNLNTASFKLLSYVSGIGPSLAKSVVSHRDEKGQFSSRDALMEVSGFGPKVFQQSAGFLRVPDSQNPLDNSSVHPESYALVEKMSSDLQLSLAELIGQEESVKTISLEKYVDDKIGMPTLLDIKSELIKPGRDPREDGSRLHYSDTVTSIEDLKEGMTLKGTVSNVTNFGAFVDIGVHQDGLVHISELSDSFIKDPGEVVSVGQVIDVRVIDVDYERKRISLSRKLDKSVASSKASQSERPANEQPPRNQRPRHPRNNQDRGVAPRHGRSQQRQRSSGQRNRDNKQHTMGDLLSKFNIRS